MERSLYSRCTLHSGTVHSPYSIECTASVTDGPWTMDQYKKTPKFVLWKIIKRQQSRNRE